MQNTYGNYSIEIQWSESKEAYRAIVPELPECKVYGTTYEEVARNLQAAIKTCIEERKTSGLPIPEPKYWEVEEDQDEERVEGRLNKA